MSEETKDSAFSGGKIVEAITAAVKEEVSRIEDETGESVESVEIIEADEPRPSTGFIYREPTTDKVTAKMMRKLGIGGRMVPIKPWMGKPRWKCDRPGCGWETFDEKKARKHCCGLRACAITGPLSRLATGIPEGEAAWQSLRVRPALVSRLS